MQLTVTNRSKAYPKETGSWLRKQRKDVRSVYSFEGTTFFDQYLLINGLVAQLVRAPPCHGGGHGFESRLGRFIWDLSSAGRASALQAEGHRFEPCRSHLNSK